MSKTKPDANHIHILRLHHYKTTGNKVFFCTDDNCYFKVECSLALGKVSICNRCGEPFKMDAENIRQTSPHCRNCVRKRIKRPGEKSIEISQETLASAIADSSIAQIETQIGELLNESNLVMDEDI